MEQLTSINILLAIAGLLLHVLLSVQRVLKGDAPFSVGRWIVENWINFAISVVCTGVSLLMADDMIKMFGVTADDGSVFYKVHAFVSGYLGRDLIFRLIKSFKKK